MKSKKKYQKRGIVILNALIAIVIVGLLGISLTSIYANMFSTLSAGRDASQAQQYAQIEGEYLKTQGYDNADSSVHDWKTMENLLGADDGNLWESKVESVRDTETDDGNKLKIVKVSVRQKGDTTSRASYEVPLSSQDNNSSMPVGAIMWYPSNHIPSGWLECNGQSTDGYTNLASVVGANVPDLRGKFIRGYSGDESILTIEENSSMTVLFDGTFPFYNPWSFFWKEKFGFTEYDNAIGYQELYNSREPSGVGFLTTGRRGADGRPVNNFVYGEKTFQGKFVPMHIALVACIKY